MQDILVTNNVLAAEELKTVCNVILLDTDYCGVLSAVRDYIHKGHKLLSHPLSGSVKPNENPFKSVLVSQKVANLDFDSLSIIENSILTAKKFEVKFKNLTGEMRKDFEWVDLSLIKSALCNKIN